MNLSCCPASARLLGLSQRAKPVRVFHPELHFAEGHCAGDLLRALAGQKRMAQESVKEDQQLLR